MKQSNIRRKLFSQEWSNSDHGDGPSTRGKHTKPPREPQTGLGVERKPNAEAEQTQETKTLQKHTRHIEPEQEMTRLGSHRRTSQGVPKQQPNLENKIRRQNS